VKGALVGKVGSVFASTATQHRVQETTITSFHATLLHHGMIIVGLPYSFAGQTKMHEVTGGTPYGTTTLAGGTAHVGRARTSLKAPASRAVMWRRLPRSSNAARESAERPIRDDCERWRLRPALSR
jgi:NAD(P)H dehydrogenase (quinone)